METINFSFLKSQSPKAWDDFLKFYQEEFGNVAFLNNVSFDQIPFDMQLGVFLKYFNKNGVELDVCNTEYTLLPDTIMDTFINFEKVISHFS